MGVLHVYGTEVSSNYHQAHRDSHGSTNTTCTKVLSYVGVYVPPGFIIQASQCSIGGQVYTVLHAPSSPQG